MIINIYNTYYMCYNCIVLKGAKMTFRDVEKMLKKDGWYYYDTVGSHMQYKHNEKPRKSNYTKT